tara:strand:+ start:196 stop:483 length:288 start_codon:yes stop_codon:yes gene_type:complete
MTFANIKRRLKKGTILRCTKNDYSKKYLHKNREIDIVQSNAVRFSGGSWLYFPKAEFVKILDKNIFSIIGGNLPRQQNKTITYKFIKERIMKNDT